MLAGGASNAGSTPSLNTSNARFAVTRMPCGRTTIAGYGRWPSRIVSSAWRTGRSASSSSGDSGNAGAKPGGEEQRVALAQRELHRLRQPHDHAAARAGSTLLDEAHVPLRRARSHRQVQLAHPAGRAPATQLARESGRRHRVIVAHAALECDSLQGVAAKPRRGRRSAHDRHRNHHRPVQRRLPRAGAREARRPHRRRLRDGGHRPGAGRQRLERATTNASPAGRVWPPTRRSSSRSSTSTSTATEPSSGGGSPAPRTTGA